MRLFCAVLILAAGAGFIGWTVDRIPDGSTDARLSGLALPVLPGMTRGAVEPALKAVNLQITSTSESRLESVSADHRNRLVVLFTRDGYVSSVTSVEVASVASAAKRERLTAVACANWQVMPPDIVNQRYVLGRYEMLVRRQFECDPITPEEFLYSIRELHDSQAEKSDASRPEGWWWSWSKKAPFASN